MPLDFRSPSARRRRRGRYVNSNDRKNPIDIPLFNGPSSNQQRTISPSQISAKERIFSARRKSSSQLINLNELKGNDRQPARHSLRMDSSNEKSPLKDPAAPSHPLENDIPKDRNSSGPDLNPRNTAPVEPVVDQGKRSSSSVKIDEEDEGQRRQRRASIASVSVKKVTRSRSSNNKTSSAKNVPHRFNHVTVRKIDRPKSSGDH